MNIFIMVHCIYGEAMVKKYSSAYIDCWGEYQGWSRIPQLKCFLNLSFVCFSNLFEGESTLSLLKLDSFQNSYQLIQLAFAAMSTNRSIKMHVSILKRLKKRNLNFQVCHYYNLYNLNLENTQNYKNNYKKNFNYGA